MAEVTYYFNHYAGIYHWTDYPYMIDGILTNYAYTSTSGLAEWLRDNTCPGDDLGTITKVEVRAYGYGDGNDRIDLTPYFGDVGPGNEHQLTMPATAGWSDYADITNDTNAPSPWTWADVVLLDMGHYPPEGMGVEFNKVGKGNTMYCAKVEIRVTFTPSAGYYHGLKVQSEGELALCDVGSHPLRIRKGGTTYGLELVAIDDPNASKVRVKTGAGVKAIRKYT